MSYKPTPIDTSRISLPKELQLLTEKLAKNAHEVWARQRLMDGWRYGLQRDDVSREHPCLIGYEQLPESEKQYDRNAAIETLKVMVALGYRIERPD